MLICIVGGNSILAAALVKMINIDAYHFCKKTVIHRKVIHSLSFQLAICHYDIAQSLLDMTPSQMESFSDDAKAWELLLETPLRSARGWQPTILIDER